MAGELLTQDYQIDWDGFRLGPGTPYDVVKIMGWLDSPALTNGAAPRNNQHGSWPGSVRAQARTVTAILDISAGENGMGQVIRDLRHATPVVRGAKEAPLAIRDNGETLVAQAKFGGRVGAIDQPYSMGLAQGFAVQWWCADPKLYELDEQSITIGGPTGGSGGLEYPLTYPLSFGFPATPSNVTVTNNGNEATSSLLEFVGPILTPRLTNSTMGFFLEFDLDLLIGQTLTVDTKRGTVLLNGTTDRLDSRSNLAVPVEYFELGAGDNNLILTGAEISSGAYVRVTWKSANL